MAAKYILKSSRNNQVVFILHAVNGEPILTSETYTTKQGAKGGIASVQTNSPHAIHFERKTANNKEKQPYFVLKAVNGQVIGTSEMYSSTQARDKGIESVMKNGATQEIEDET